MLGSNLPRRVGLLLGSSSFVTGQRVLVCFCPFSSLLLRYRTRLVIAGWRNRVVVFSSKSSDIILLVVDFLLALLSSL